RSSWRCCGDLSQRNEGQRLMDSKHGPGRSRFRRKGTRILAVWPLFGETQFCLGRILVQRKKLRQPLLRASPNLEDQVPSPPALDNALAESCRWWQRFDIVIQTSSS